MEPKSKLPCIDLNTPNIYIDTYAYIQGFPVGSAVKNLPAVQETQVLSLGWEDPLEKEMATHSSILAWRIPWTEEPGGDRKSVV